MQLSAKTLSWEPIVRAELARQSVPLPSDLILRVIQVESQGHPGIVNPSSGASGLMQIMPTTLDTFNKKSGRSYTLSDMRGTSYESARRQIEAGIWVLSHYWKVAYDYLSNRLSSVPIDQVGKIADANYTAGPGNVHPKLDTLPVPSWEGMAAKYPGFNALPHQVKIFSTPIAWNVPAIENWIGEHDKIGKIVKSPKSGFMIGVGILMLAYWLMKSKGKQDE